VSWAENACRSAGVGGGGRGIEAGAESRRAMGGGVDRGARRVM
jgi:hypothetical protein